VGAFEESTFEQGQRQLKPGDTLVLFSDGVVEAVNASGEEFGEVRVGDAVQELTRGAPPEQVLDGLLHALEEFRHGTPPIDDMTAVVIRYGRSR
jgi:sigma-B regulation protein RsbU (phosphoserine phosphatase)